MSQHKFISVIDKQDRPILAATDSIVIPKNLHLKENLERPQIQPLPRNPRLR